MTDMAEKRRSRAKVYSRIVGYLRPVQNWNKGKRQEFEDRRAYQIKHPNSARQGLGQIDST